MEEKIELPAVTKAEHNTILAALRFWQSAVLAQVGIPQQLYDIVTDGDVEPLSVTEIDTLCEALN